MHGPPSRVPLFSVHTVCSHLEAASTAVIEEAKHHEEEKLHARDSKHEA